MANVSVYNMEGKEVGTLELNDAAVSYTHLILALTERRGSAGIPSSRRRIWTDMTAMWNGFIFPITESQRRQIRTVWIHRI